MRVDFLLRLDARFPYHALRPRLRYPFSFFRAALLRGGFLLISGVRVAFRPSFLSLFFRQGSPLTCLFSRQRRRQAACAVLFIVLRGEFSLRQAARTLSLSPPRARSPLPISLFSCFAGLGYALIRVGLGFLSSCWMELLLRATGAGRCLCPFSKRVC